MAKTYRLECFGQQLLRHRYANQLLGKQCIENENYAASDLVLLLKKLEKNSNLCAFFSNSSNFNQILSYIDNLYGPTGVVAGAGTGVLRTLHCDPDITANIVPVDMTVNALIASAWDVATNYKDAWYMSLYLYCKKKKNLHNPAV